MLVGSFLAGATLLSHAIGLPGTGHIEEVEAAYTSVSPDGLTRSYITRGVTMFSKTITKHDDVCGRAPEYTDGGYCIHVAGGGLFGTVKEVRFYRRLSNFGHDKPWEPCVRELGCRAFDHMVWPAEGRTRATKASSKKRAPKGR